MTISHEGIDYAQELREIHPDSYERHETLRKQQRTVMMMCKTKLDRGAENLSNEDLNLLRKMEVATTFNSFCKENGRMADGWQKAVKNAIEGIKADGTNKPSRQMRIDRDDAIKGINTPKRDTNFTTTMTLGRGL